MFVSIIPQFPNFHAPQNVFHIGQTPQFDHPGITHDKGHPSRGLHYLRSYVVAYYGQKFAMAVPPLNSAVFLSLIARSDATKPKGQDRGHTSYPADDNPADVGVQEEGNLLDELVDSSQRLSASEPPVRLPPVFSNARRCKCTGSVEYTKSRQYDVLWYRLTSCINHRPDVPLWPVRRSLFSEFSTSFVPGSIGGHWSGKLMVRGIVLSRSEVNCRSCTQAFLPRTCVRSPLVAPKLDSCAVF